MTPAEVADFRAGDHALFRRLVEELSPRLLAYATNLTRDPERARDLVQESWMQAYRKRESFSGDGSLMAWLIAIAYRRFISDGRRSAWREAQQHLVPVHGKRAVSADTVVRSTVSAAMREAIASAVGELPARQREVVVRRLIESQSISETAAELGIAEGTVKATLHRAMRTLRNLLKEWRE